MYELIDFIIEQKYQKLSLEQRARVDAFVSSLETNVSEDEKVLEGQKEGDKR